MAHTYWRLNITRAGAANASLGEVEMRNTIGGVDLCTGGTALSSSNYTASNNAAKAFDDISTTCWVANTTAPAWIGYQFSSPVDIVEYTVTARSDGTTSYIYTAADWTLEWSDDGVSWTVADTRVTTYDWFYLQKRIYRLGDPLCRIIIHEAPLQVPSNFLGMHDANGVTAAADIDLKYAAFRAHDCLLSWDKIETADNVFNWTNMDAMVNAQAARGATIMFPIQGTPIHAVNRAWLESKSTVWQANTVYTTLGIGTVVRSTDPTNNRLYILTQAGTSGATEPAWSMISSGGSCSLRNQTSGIAVCTDNTCKWQVLGDIYNNVMGAAPQDLTKLTRFVTTLLNRYNTGGSHKIWALELGSNEPNFSENYTFFYWGSAQNLVDASYTAKQAALAVDSTVKFISPGFLNSSNFTNTTNVWNNTLVTGGGGLRGSDLIDGSAWHPYTGNKEVSRRLPRYGDFGILKHWQAASAWTSPRPNIDLYNTEWGTSTSFDADLTQFKAETPKTRKRQLTRFIFNNACSGVKGVYLYRYGNNLCGDLVSDTYGARAAVNSMFEQVNGRVLDKTYELEDGSFETYISGVKKVFGEYNKKTYTICGTTVHVGE